MVGQVLVILFENSTEIEMFKITDSLMDQTSVMKEISCKYHDGVATDDHLLLGCER